MREGGGEERGALEEVCESEGEDCVPEVRWVDPVIVELLQPVWCSAVHTRCDTRRDTRWRCGEDAAEMRRRCGGDAVKMRCDMRS